MRKNTQRTPYKLDETQEFAPFKSNRHVMEKPAPKTAPKRLPIVGAKPPKGNFLPINGVNQPVVQLHKKKTYTVSFDEEQIKKLDKFTVKNGFKNKSTFVQRIMNDIIGVKNKKRHLRPGEELDNDE